MKNLLKPVIIAVLWLLIWEILYLIVNLEVLLPSPITTFKELIRLCGEISFWQSVLFSMFRILIGFMLGIITGVLLAILTSSLKAAQDFFAPMISIARSTPVASFIVLALVWIDKGSVPIFTSFLIVFPVAWGNISQGIKETDLQLLEMSSAFKMPFKSKIKYIYIPSVWPYFTAAATTSMGMAWKAGIAAEVIATPLYSIGRGIYNSKIYLNTTELFAWTIVIIILSIILEKIITHFLGKKRAVSS